ncbi:MAG: S8 family serine peptidase [Deltaproteobacteria bacterium]|nr:S8 family serine peptidase [Deltaproteobacteria bacterium]
MKRVVLAAFAIFLIAGLWLEVQTGIFTRLLARPVTVAVLDTGVDARIPAIAERLSSKKGRNFFDKNDDVSDSDGHGTKVALLVAQGCGKIGCQILPIKMTKSGAGMSPADLAAAIGYALENGARVINISAGMTQGSPALDQALENAERQGAIVVTAAGNGITNPFRPEPLAKVHPQASPRVLVVGAAKALDDPDFPMNFGDELDVVVTGQPGDAFGSSFAAAEVSGAVAAFVLASHRHADLPAVRAALRASAQAPKSAFRAMPLPEAVARLGFGAFDSQAFIARAPSWLSVPLAAHRFADAGGRFDFELGANYPVLKVEAGVTCGGNKAIADEYYTVLGLAADRAAVRGGVVAELVRRVRDRARAETDLELRVAADRGAVRGGVVAQLVGSIRARARAEVDLELGVRADGRAVRGRVVAGLVRGIRARARAEADLRVDVRADRGAGRGGVVALGVRGVGGRAPAEAELGFDVRADRSALASRSHAVHIHVVVVSRSRGRDREREDQKRRFHFFILFKTRARGISPTSPRHYSIRKSCRDQSPRRPWISTS